MKRDRAIPDMPTMATRSISMTQLPTASPIPEPQYPWTRLPLFLPQHQDSASGSKLPYPRYGASANNICSKKGHIYLQGGMVNATRIKEDLWRIESKDVKNAAQVPI